MPPKARQNAAQHTCELTVRDAQHLQETLRGSLVMYNFYTLKHTYTHIHVYMHECKLIPIHHNTVNTYTVLLQKNLTAVLSQWKYAQSII